jgi:polysaccharide export outer membrane protein
MVMRRLPVRVLSLVATISLLIGPASVWAQEPDQGLYATYGRYRLQVGDVFELQYRYTPEFNQTVAVQPDGFVTLQIAGTLRVAGLTVDEARLAVLRQSERRLKDPEVAFILKDFEKASFTVGGEVTRPGKFDLRGRTTPLEAIAQAGGFTTGSKHSQVLLVRRLDDARAEVIPLNMKRIEREPQLAEEYPLRSGDLLFVPRNAISKIERIVRWTSLGFSYPLFR